MGLRILVVDDDPQVREVLGMHLARSGYCVVQASDGKAAIKRLNEESFDLVISDIVMPEQDGLEVLMFVHKKYPTTKVIAISAPGNDLFLKSAKGLGAWRVMRKPFTLQEITEVVEQVPRA